MKTRILVLSALALIAVQAHAEVTDADGNGAYSFEEMQAAYPDMTEELFADIDADEDGEISADELADAVANGQIEN